MQVTIGRHFGASSVFPYLFATVCSPFVRSNALKMMNTQSLLINKASMFFSFNPRFVSNHDMRLRAACTGHAVKVPVCLPVVFHRSQSV